MTAEQSTEPTAAAGYTRMAYPGTLGIPPVGIAIDVPDGWVTTVGPGPLAAIREPEADESAVVANVIPSITRLPAGADLGVVGSELLADAEASVERFVLSGEHIIEVDGGRPAILREQTLTIPQSPLTIIQFVLIVLVEVGGGAAVDCVQLTGSVEAARRDAFAAVFQHLAGSLTIDA